MGKGTLKDKKITQDKERQAYAFYVSQGWTPEQAIGIVGNLIRESNLTTTIVGTADDKGSQGIAQWHGDRLKSLKNKYGNNWTDFRNQLEFVDWELKNTEKAAGDKLRKTKGVWEAGTIVSDHYERPKVKFVGDEKRQSHVSDLAMKFKGIKLTPEDMPYANANYANSVAPYMNQQKEIVTNTINNFDFLPQTTTFASVPDSAQKENKTEETDKDIAEVEQKTKEFNFLDEVNTTTSFFKPREKQQNEPPQTDYMQQYEQISQFIDNPVAQQGKKFKLKDERNLVQKDNTPNTKRDLSLMLAEYNNAKKDEQELRTTGQIKNPNSIQYRRNVKTQPDIKQDNISTEQRNAPLNPLQRPLIYLANPNKVLGDLGVPNMETSELDRQAINANVFNPNQSRTDRFLNNAKIGLGYVPEATVNTALAAAFMPEGSGALGLVNEALNPLAGLKTSIPDSMKQGLRTNGLTFNGFKREYPINNYQREASKDVERLFKEFPELEKIGSKEDYLKHLETIFPETSQPGIFYRGTRAPNALETSEWVLNPSGGNNLGEGYYFTPDPFKAEKYGTETKALLNIKKPTYTSVRLNDISVPSNTMTKDLVGEGDALVSIENPTVDLFTKDNYIHKYTGDLDERGFPVTTTPSPQYPDYKEYSRIDELAVPSTSQIHMLGSNADKEAFTKYISKQVPKTDNFKSEINWSKWNKEIPENSQLIKEYNTIEQQAKTNNTWMKNPDGSAFQGTPEQFVQQNSENFKKAFGNSKLVNPDGSPTIQYHGSAKKFDTFDESKFQLGDAGYSGSGIYTTPNKTKASSYSLSSKSIHKDGNLEPTIYELYGQGNNPISAEELIKQNKDYDLFNFHRSKDWQGNVPLERQMRDYDVAIRNQTRGVERISPWNDADELVFPTNKQLKSAIGNNGMFDMNNPNIYKSVVPIAGASYLATQGQEQNPPQYQQGGQQKFTENELAFLSEIAIKDNQGQRNHPNKVTKIEGNVMATDGYGDIPLYVIPNKGKPKVVNANTGQHKFKEATEFIEIPLFKK